MSLRTVMTGDGSMTIFNPELNEHYHSVHGAILESNHIFIREGFQKIPNFPVSILEVGFGTGLNAFLTFLESRSSPGKIHFTAIEKYPLQDQMISSLNYPEILNPSAAADFKAMHSAEWNRETMLSGMFILLKRNEDLRTLQLPEASYNLVYFDAFSPAVQPELWTEEIFRKLNRAMKPGAFLVTYSVKGAVTRALAATGFNVEKLPGPPGKREMMRATKPGK